MTIFLSKRKKKTFNQCDQMLRKDNHQHFVKNHQICFHNNKLIFQTPNIYIKGSFKSLNVYIKGKNQLVYMVKNHNYGFSKNCQIWAKKLPPKTSKNCQNGDISPHLVTLLATSEERFYRDPSRLKKVAIKITRVQNRIFQICAKTKNS